MSGNVTRTVAGQIDVRGNDAAAVTSHDLHRDAGAALQVTADVAAVPCEIQRDLRINACFCYFFLHG